jgi:hypothetical protein
VRAVPRLCDCYPGICLTPEEKARKTLKSMENPKKAWKNLKKHEKHVGTMQKTERINYRIVHLLVLRDSCTAVKC